MSLPPGPSSPALAQTWRWIRRPYEFLEECRAKYGKTFTFSFVGGRKLVMTADRDAVQQVFSGDPDVYRSGAANKNFTPYFGEHSVVVVDGEPHKAARRLLMPPFRGERMQAYTDIVRDLTLADMASWPVGTPFPILEPMQRVALEVIYEAVFGVKDRAQRDEMTSLLAKLMSKTTGTLVFLTALQKDLGPLSPWGRYVRLRARFSDLLFAEIARARAEKADREDILARMIVEAEEKGLPLTDEMLRDQLITLLTAGHETTATSLGWTWQLLLSHPDALAKARAEVAEVVGDGPVLAEHVRKLDYLDAVAQEALRLFPPIPIVLRKLAQPVSLVGYDLPADTIVCPVAYLLHREPDIYPDPLAYRPERHLGNRPGPFDFLAFGGGARTCVGIGFAYFEMKIVLATVLANARLRLAGTPSLAYRRTSIVMAPRAGTPVVLEERTPAA
jgi:cytochrome P450